MIIFHSIPTLSFLPFSVYTHGLLIGFGVVIGYILAHFRLKRYHDFQEIILDGTVFASILGGLFGARLLYVTLNYQNYDSIVEILKIWEGGLVSFGGLIGGAFTGILYLRYKKQNVWKWADFLGPYLILGWGIARIGDFLSWGEFGTPTGLPWGVAVDGDIPRHPTQIYTTILFILFFFIFRNLYQSWKKYQGKLASVILIVYGVFRFLIELIRDYPHNEYPFFYRYFAQIMSVVFIVLGVGLYLYCRKKFWKSLS